MYKFYGYTLENANGDRAQALFPNRVVAEQNAKQMGWPLDTIKAVYTLAKTDYKEPIEAELIEVTEPEAALIDKEETWSEP